MRGAACKKQCLEVLGDPLFGQRALISDELAECFRNLRLNRRTHERNGDVDLIVVGQSGGVGTSRSHGTLEVNRCALHISGVIEGEGIPIEFADGDDALDLQRLGDHGAHGLRQKVHRHDFVQDGLVAVEGMNLASFGGEVGHVVSPVVRVGQCGVHFIRGVVDRHGVLCARSHRQQTTVRCMSEILTPDLMARLRAFDGVDVQEATFASLTTLRVGGRPLACVVCNTTESIAQVVGLLDEHSVPLLVVGGGSNLLVSDDDVAMVAVVLNNRGVKIDACDTSAGDGPVYVRAQAGVVWDDLVAQTVDRGLGGLECLSGIPGSVGATPVQNVGAYGVEVSDMLRRVRLYDRTSGELEWVEPEALDLAYRYSNLKFTGRAVVVEVEFQLSTDGLSAPLRFGELARTLGVTEQEGSGARRPVAQVRDAVLGLRRGKGMVVDPNDHDTWSAGSFFTNPIVDAASIKQVRERIAAHVPDDTYATMPCFEVDGGYKLSAAWLIDKAGFTKGYPGEGAPARLSTKHTLALTNRGDATAADVVALARDVQRGVNNIFGVHLEPEPVWVGF